MSEPVTSERIITAEELARTPALGRCELVEGRIVRMSPTGHRHGGVEARIGKILANFVDPRKIGRVLVGEVGVYTRRNPDTVRGADVLYISKERFQRASKDKAFLDAAPELVVEVLSPDDRPAELARKLSEYFAVGVLLVWVADPESRSVRAYRSPSDVRELGEEETLTGDEALPGFEAPVAQFFEE